MKRRLVLYLSLGAQYDYTAGLSEHEKALACGIFEVVVALVSASTAVEMVRSGQCDQDVEPIQKGNVKLCG